MDALANLDVLKILGYGLSGLGFLLMYLAYRLLNKLSDKENPSKLIISSINRFIVICLLMTIVVGVFTYFDRDYKTTELANKTDAYNVLSASKKISDLTDSIKYYASSPDNNKKTNFVKEQAKVLDTLSRYVAKENNPQATQKFNNYKNLILTIPKKIGTNANNEPLFVHYRKVTDSLTKMTSQIATKKSRAQ
jgi:hypothetical protein